MTVRKRLFLSNILMILVPVIAMLLIGILCVAFIMVSLLGGAGLGLEDRGQFEYVYMAFIEVLETGLETGTDLSALEKMLDGNGMTVTVIQDGSVFYHYGKEKDNDGVLLDAASFLGSDAFLVQDGRSLLVHREAIGGYDGQDEFLPLCEAFNEMAERLKVLICQIQKQERSRKELIAGISHDIRSP